MRYHNEEVIHESCIFPVSHRCGHFEFRIIVGGTTLNKYKKICKLEKSLCNKCYKKTFKFYILSKIMRVINF